MHIILTLANWKLCAPRSVALLVSMWRMFFSVFRFFGYFIDWRNVGSTHASINVHKWNSFTSVWLPKFTTTGSWLPWNSSSSHKRQIATHVSYCLLCVYRLPMSRRSTIRFFLHKTPTWIVRRLICRFAQQKFRHFTYLPIRFSKFHSQA